jgi:hypothetical protein
MHVPWLIIVHAAFGRLCSLSATPQPADAFIQRRLIVASLFNNSTNAISIPAELHDFWGVDGTVQFRKQARPASSVATAAHGRAHYKGWHTFLVYSDLPVLAECIGAAAGGGIVCQTPAVRQRPSVMKSLHGGRARLVASSEQATPLLTSRAHNQCGESGRTGRTAAHKAEHGRSGIPRDLDTLSPRI